MSDDINRKARLLALAEENEREAKRFSDESNEYDAERCEKLTAVYREMAEEAK
jgi:hypothetical protein